MTDQLRKIIRPKPYLIGLEITLIIVINLLVLGGYLIFSLEAITWSHKAHYLFWSIWLLTNHLLFTLITDSLTHHLTAGYELTDDHLIIVKAGWLGKPKITKIPFDNLVTIGEPHANKLELTVKHSPQPQVCRILQNGKILCQEVKEHWRLYNLRLLENTDLGSFTNPITNNPRFILVEEERN